MVAKFLDLNNLSLQRKPFALSNDERKAWATVLILSDKIMHRKLTQVMPIFFLFCSAIFARPRFCWDPEFFATIATWRNDFPLIKLRIVVVECCLRAVFVTAAVMITCHSSNDVIAGAFEVHSVPSTYSQCMSKSSCSHCMTLDHTHTGSNGCGLLCSCDAGCAITSNNSLNITTQTRNGMTQ